MLEGLDQKLVQMVFLCLLLSNLLHTNMRSRIVTFQKTGGNTDTLHLLEVDKTMVVGSLQKKLHFNQQKYIGESVAPSMIEGY